MTEVVKRKSKSLAGHRIGISASLDGRGSNSSELTEADLNQFVGTIALTLLSRGAKLVFGHDWRPDGVMTEILRVAQAYHAPVEPQQVVDRVPLITACVAWPDEPYADKSDLQRLTGVLAVEKVEIPTDLAPMSTGDGRLELQKKNPKASYLRSRSLTRMRRHLTNLCTGRICLGGKRTGFTGRAPGVVEEAWMTLTAGKPLYLSSLLGGVTSDLIAAFTAGSEMPEQFCEPDPQTADEFRRRQRGTNADDGDNKILKPQAIWNEFAHVGLTGLAQTNGLSAGENRKLMEAVTLEEAMGLVVEGLSNVQSKW